MSTAAIQPDLIISLSQDKVRLNLSEDPESGRQAWQTTFEVDNIFLQEQISNAMDQALLENPSLIDHFPCVEIVVLDQPSFFIPKQYADNGNLGEIAARYLRLRMGDTLTTDRAEDDAVICYCLPTETMMMFKEYYSNAGCNHLSSILWHHLSSYQNRPDKNVTRLYFIVLDDILILLSELNSKLIFSKNFSIRDKADLFYYAIACSRMIKANEHWLVTIEDETSKFEMPGDSVLKIDEKILVPALQVLMSQFKVCE